MPYVCSWFVDRCSLSKPGFGCHEQRTTNNQLFYDPQKVRYLRNDPTGRGSVRPGHRLIELRDPEASDDLLLLLRVADRAAIILDRDVSAVFFFYFLCHLSISDCGLRIADLSAAPKSQCKIETRVRSQIRQPRSRIPNQTSSSTDFPRSLATSMGSFILESPLKVARTTL
jgi:hypothetical protein